MRNMVIVGVFLASSLMVAGCAQQGSTDASSKGEVAPPSSAQVISTTGVAPAKDSVMLFNAYTAKTLDTNHNAGAPTGDFAASDKVYVGVVMHGEATAAAVKVGWSLLGGPQLGSEEATIPVVKDATATFDLSKAGPLKAGSYKVLVMLDGKPSWELKFNVD